MKRLIAAAMMCTAVMILSAGSAFADNVHLFTNTSGQPDSGGSIVNCGANGLVSTPGNGSATFANSMGSPYGSTALAGSKYAGSQPQNSNNPKSISQYDVSCFQATMHQSQ
jgi:hypothetical protein